MGNDFIKDFVKKQTTPINIGSPKPKVQVQIKEDKKEEPVSAAEPQTITASAEPKVKKPIGRPKSDVQKIKLSAYVPEELKAKMIKIQHRTYKTNLNDVMVEAIVDLIKKYGE